MSNTIMGNKLKPNEFISLMIDYVSASKIKDIIPIMLWGSPGVGKSQAMRQVGSNIEELTAGRGTPKKVIVTDVRLLLFNPVDLRGIPVADDKKQFGLNNKI